MSDLRKHFTAGRGVLAAGAFAATVSVSGCANPGTHRYEPLPEKEPTKLVEVLNDAAGCAPNDDSCRTQLGRTVMWGGAVLGALGVVPR